MDFRLVDSGWDGVIDAAVQADHSELRIVCPFIKQKAAGRLLARGRPKRLLLITRFNLNDMAEGVTDLRALRMLLSEGAEIRGIKNLHSKVYLFGARRAMVTSANLTEAALTRNHEFGVVSDDASVIANCRGYFDNLWQQAGTSLTAVRLEQWEQRLASHLAKPRVIPALGLGDEGVDVGLAPQGIELPPSAQEVGQAIVKWFGDSKKRWASNVSVLEEVRVSGSHWACSFPRSVRPRRVEDGALMFLARITRDPNDILVYGRAIGMAHVDGRDEASLAEIALRPWKADYSNYVRIHNPQFLAGTLQNGVSLNALMDALGSNSFASTQRNARAGEGNTDPRHAYSQKSSVELSREGLAWLNARLEAAFARHGRIPAAHLAGLDWPAPVGGVPLRGRP